MRTLKRFLQTILAGASCYILFTALSQSVLPDTWPESMKMTLKQYGGRNGRSQEIEVSANGYEHILQRGHETKKALSFSQDELNGLLHVLKKYNFEKIKSVRRKSIAYDKPTTQVTLTWNSNSWSVTSGASEEISESDKENYQQVVSSLTTLLQTKNVQWP